MPLHTIGLKVPGSWYGITFADVMSLVVAGLYFGQPGLDHKEAFKWITAVPFGGSMACVAIAGTFFSHKIFEWCGLGLFQIMYSLDARRDRFALGRLFHSAKIDTSVDWAWDSPKKEVGEKYQDLKSRSIWYIIKFHICVTIFQFFYFYISTNWRWTPEGTLTWEWLDENDEYRRADPELIPSKATVAFQCIVSTFIGETGFYFGHRLMHETSLYYWHKRHHEYKHSTAYAAFYVGFFDSLITDLIPAGIGIIMFDMHQWTIWMFSLPLIANSLRVHSGYDNARILGFNPTTTLPFCTDMERTHDIHHRVNMCNYGGAFFIWDRLLGTYRNPDDEIAEKKGQKSVVPVAQQLYETAADKVKES